MVMNVMEHRGRASLGVGAEKVDPLPPESPHPPSPFHLVLSWPSHAPIIKRGETPSYPTLRC